MKSAFKFKYRELCAAAAVAVIAAGCGGDDDGEDVTEAEVADGYAAIVRANYADSLTTATALRTAVDAFVATPTAATLEAAKTAWKAAREPYGQTESYRFYDGPIDNPDNGPEGQINAWPLDEGYVDYVIGAPDSGIINNTVTFPDITKQLIADQNELGAEENISSGYHAIEFLLWGQDTSDTGPGARSFEDYLTPAPNFARRGLYLKLTAELLVDDLTAVSGAWSDGAAYANDFSGNPREALRRMIQGMGSLSGAELSGERMTVALDSTEQENEHSCFSDNTHRDLLGNAIAIQNVYLGRYKTVAGTTVDGPGIDELVRARNPELDTKMQQQLAASITAIEAIPAPFDQAIKAEPGKGKVQAAINALVAETATIVEVATLLGITINLE